MWGENQILFLLLHTQDSHGNTINKKKTRIEDIEEVSYLCYGLV
jgi:hypothetical protein